MTIDDPVVAQIQLGILLRELRDRAQLNAAEAARHIESSNASMSRIENGQQVIKPEDVALLLDLYDATDAESSEALRLAAVPKPRARRRRSSSYRDAVPNWFRRFLVMESEATEISIYDNEVVTGLLQTDAYARSLLRAGAPLAGEQELDKKVELRLGRQRVLTRDDPPPVQLEVVLNEATLHRVNGSDEIMQGQLQHLLDVSQIPTVRLRVLAFRPKPTPNRDECFIAAPSFQLLKLPDRGTVLYMDDFAGATYPEDVTVIQQYATAYQRLRAAADDPDTSRTLIAKIAKQNGWNVR